MRNICGFALAVTVLAMVGCGELKDGFDGDPCEGNTEGLVFGANLTPERAKDSDGIVESKHCSFNYPHCILYDVYKYACSVNKFYGQISCGDMVKDALHDKNNCGRCGTECDECDNGMCIKFACQEDGVKRCSGNELQTCDNHQWKKERDCGYQCETDHCIDTKPVCEENKIYCSNDKKKLLECKDNTETTKETCIENSHCVEESLECKCNEDYKKCGDACVDIKTDKENCGGCGIESPSGCSDGKKCVVSYLDGSNGSSTSDKYFRKDVDYPGGCCDNAAKGYVYLSGRPECEDAKYEKDPQHDYSLPFCMTDNAAKTVQNYTKCMQDYGEISNLSEAASCGTTYSEKAPCPYHAEDKRKGTLIEEMCTLGRCCFPDDVIVTYNRGGDELYIYDKNGEPVSVSWGPELCCSGHAYYRSPYGGTYWGCTDNPKWCEDNEHIYTCYMDEDIKKNGFDKTKIPSN